MPGSARALAHYRRWPREPERVDFTDAVLMEEEARRRDRDGRRGRVGLRLSRGPKDDEGRGRGDVGGDGRRVQFRGCSHSLCRGLQSAGQCERWLGQQWLPDGDRLELLPGQERRGGLPDTRWRLSWLARMLEQHHLRDQSDHVYLRRDRWRGRRMELRDDGCCAATATCGYRMRGRGWALPHRRRVLRNAGPQKRVRRRAHPGGPVLLPRPVATRRRPECNSAWPP